MRTAVWIIVIALIGAVGAYLLSGYGKEDREQSRLMGHVEVVHEQMMSLANHLKQFKKAHGRYPSTDEGLSVLNKFAARIEITMCRFPPGDRADDLYSLNSWGVATHSSRFWSVTRERVQDYRVKHGHPPGTLKELYEAGFGRNLGMVITTTEERLSHMNLLGLELADRELAIGHDDVLFLVGPAGVLSPWQMPYVYENRNESPRDIFTDSPVDNYGAERYSVKIDDGVYLWSVGAQNYSGKYRRIWL